MIRALAFVIALVLAGCLDDTPTHPEYRCDTLSARDSVATCQLDDS